MSSTSATRNPPHQFLFYRDLASPVTVLRRRHDGSPHSREAADPPPPPAFTLDERLDLSPEPELPSPLSPSPSPRSPATPYPFWSPSSSFKARGGERSGSPPATPGAVSWLCASDGTEGKGRESPVNGVVERTALLALPPPLSQAVEPYAGVGRALRSPLDPRVEEGWVTVFGFSPVDTNLVLREFERCGVIQKHVPGPSGSNWLHVLYQSPYDAQTALLKNGTKINSVLVVGVKPIDPMHQRFLEDKLSRSHQMDFMASLQPRLSSTYNLGVTPRPFLLQASGTTPSNGACRSSAAVATSSKSVVSRIMHLMFD